MNFVDYKFSNLLGGRLERFKVKNTQPFEANFRCHVCGDSKISKTKTRGWIIEKDNKAFYYCHNCGYSKPLWFFLKTHFPALYDEYVIDSKLDDIGDRPKLKKKEIGLDTLRKSRPKFVKNGSPLKEIKKISSLQADHPAKLYVQRRGIPSAQHHRLWYAPKFKRWVNTLIPGKFDDLRYDEPRLILPFIDESDTVFGFQGRSFRPNGLRYITIMLDETKAKVFGLDQVNLDDRYYVVEGPIDSLFLPNCVAMAGADVKLSNPSHAIYVYDNEPRGLEIIKRMERDLKEGKRLVIWPESLKQKDINDMWLAGINPIDIIDENIYSDLYGEFRLKQWRKVHEHP